MRQDRRCFTILKTAGQPWGASDELWWSAACSLRASGHDVSVLRTMLDHQHPRILHLRSIGCPVSNLSSRLAARAGLAASLALPIPPVPARWDLHRGRGEMMLAASILALRRPELVVLSQSSTYDGAHFAKVCRRLRVPYVLIAHGSSDFHWPVDDVRGYFADAYSRARACMFVSEHNRSLTQEQLGVRLENAYVVRNPFLAGHSGPIPWLDLDSDELRLACVARLSAPDKGQDLLLRVLAQQSWRKRPVSLRLYGDGVNRTGLMELARNLGCINVSFAGQLADIEQVWRENHALVLPSRTEGLPIALVEAMMCGRPAIVTDVGGNREIVRDGVDGILASCPSVSALDSALERFWKMRREWRQMGHAAAQRIRSVVPIDPGSVLADLLVEIVSRSGRDSTAVAGSRA